MLIVKIIKGNIAADSIKKYIFPSIFKYLKESFRDNKINVIDDSKNIEFISSSCEKKTDSYTIELTYKKTITINNSGISEKQFADRIISEVKNFCDQSVNTETYMYLPLTMRVHDNADNGTSSARNRINRP